MRFPLIIKSFKNIFTLILFLKINLTNTKFNYQGAQNCVKFVTAKLHALLKADMYRLCR